MAASVTDFQSQLPVRERQIVQPNRIRRLLVVSILLIIDRDAIPLRSGWSFVMVQRRGVSIQSN